MWYHCDALGWGNWVVNGALLIGTLAVFAVVLTWVGSQLRRRSPTRTERADPLEITRSRLATGEITIEEFEAIRDRLSG